MESTNEPTELVKKIPYSKTKEYHREKNLKAESKKYVLRNYYAKILGKDVVKDIVTKNPHTFIEIFRVTVAQQKYDQAVADLAAAIEKLPKDL
tara:strand:+ start:453 stop:731 length:279 start_codon:yes stop_codon:yes gene_type:complete